MSLVLTGTSGASNLDSTNGLQFATWTTGTRPASPIAGQMGYNTTTNAFDAYVNGAWVSIASSATAPTSGPAFSAYAGAGTSIPNNTVTKINFNTKEFDTATCYDTSTSRFTPNVAGYYLVNLQYQYSTASSTTQAIIRKNGSNFKNGGTQSGSGVNLFGAGTSAIIYLNGSTDYVEGAAYQASGSSQTTAAGVEVSYFQAAMVRTA